MKYEITYGCGHKGTVELVGSGKDRERKIRWYETYGLCPECYKSKKREEEKEKGLVLEVYMSVLDAEQPILLMFGGETYPNKDKIKAAGYFFGNDYPVKDYGDLIGIQGPQKRWWKTFSEKDALEEMKKWQTRGVKIQNHVTRVSYAMYRETLKKKKDQGEAL